VRLLRISAYEPLDIIFITTIAKDNVGSCEPELDLPYSMEMTCIDLKMIRYFDLAFILFFYPRQKKTDCLAA
jgi:hypothetical protein